MMVVVVVMVMVIVSVVVRVVVMVVIRRGVQYRSRYFIPGNQLSMPEHKRTKSEKLG